MLESSSPLPLHDRKCEFEITKIKLRLDMRILQAIRNEEGGCLTTERTAQEVNSKILVAHTGHIGFSLDFRGLRWIVRRYASEVASNYPYGVGLGDLGIRHLQIGGPHGYKDQA